MPSASSLTTLTLKPMTRGEAAALVKQMLGSYASLNLHDPETYIAQVVTVLSGYPLWCGERAVSKAIEVATFAPPSVGILKPLLEDHVRVSREAAEWEARSRKQVEGRLLLAPPAERKLSYDELKAKYGDGKGGWGIGTPRLPDPGVERERLVGMVGQAAFDAIPDQGDVFDKSANAWKKPGIDVDALRGAEPQAAE